MDSIDARLARVQERIQRERAAGIPERRPAPDLAVAPARRVPKADDQVERERKQALWDSICKHEPNLAQFLRDLKGHGFTYELLSARTPDVVYGPDIPEFQAIRIEVRLPSAADLKSKGIKR